MVQTYFLIATCLFRWGKVNLILCLIFFDLFPLFMSMLFKTQKLVIIFKNSTLIFLPNRLSGTDEPKSWQIPISFLGDYFSVENALLSDVFCSAIFFIFVVLMSIQANLSSFIYFLCHLLTNCGTTFTSDSLI
jgi:hypothetical protein